jgi:hypothetical protein
MISNAEGSKSSCQALMDISTLFFFLSVQILSPVSSQDEGFDPMPLHSI